MSSPGLEDRVLGWPVARQIYRMVRELKSAEMALDGRGVLNFKELDTDTLIMVTHDSSADKTDSQVYANIRFGKN